MKSSSAAVLIATEVASQMADQATGCYGRAELGKLYANGGASLTPVAAAQVLRNEQTVEVPNAGAGSYASFFAALGFSEVKTIETTSSAGDWLLGVRDAATGHWHPAWQHNRYPYHGFSYVMEPGQAFESFAELCEFASWR